PFNYFSDSGYLNRSRCYFLWKSASFNWDGSVSPCCCVYDPSTDFGSICEEDFATIWNNDLFQSARAACTGRLAPKKAIRTVCSQCRVFRKA
ncbi:MAG TPA: SPASM domain-containing protein, partial [bacterium]|nr:SPASM domain-containing protein [bacterium]